MISQRIDAGSDRGPDLEAYCERIRYSGALEPSLQCLQDLATAHVYAIPYENLEIHLGRTMVLDPELLESLILSRRRGGYCFQMNLLFARVLEAIGFPVSLLPGRVWLTSEGAVPPPAHLVLEVMAGSEPWLVDAGWGGGGLRLPVRLKDGATSLQGGRHYRLRADEKFGTRIERLEGDQWFCLYSFDSKPAHAVDFEHSNFYFSMSPDSFFVQNRVCTLQTPDGEKTLFNETLRIRSVDEVHELRIEDGPGYVAALEEHFGIVLPVGETLKPLLWR